MARTHAMHRRAVVAFGGSIMVAALFAWLPLQAVAADLRQGSDVTVPPGETVNDDIYAGAGTVSISGTVNGSVIAGGGTITVSGTITRDLILGGGTINVTGHVGGSIIAAGGNITVNGPIAHDLVVTAGTIDVGSGATIGRDLVVAGGTATVSAPIARRVQMSSGSLTLRNRVGGDVRGRVDHLKLDGAQVGGNLDYTSNNSVQRVNGARVAGTTTRHTPTDRGGDAGNSFLGWLRALIGIFALGLLLIFLFPGLSTRAIDIERAQPWASAGIGAAILVTHPALDPGAGHWLRHFRVPAGAADLRPAGLGPVPRCLRAAGRALRADHRRAHPGHRMAHRPGGGGPRCRRAGAGGDLDAAGGG